MTVDSKESVLSRWSRRKLEAERGAEAPPEVPAEVDVKAAVSETADEKPLLTDADMPPLESLNEDSDFSVFMSAGVSDELRNLALRKLFGAPVFNIRDGLDEYDEDYTTFEKLGDIVTSDMKHRIEMQELKKREAELAELEARQEAEELVEDIDDEIDETDETDMIDEEPAQLASSAESENHNEEEPNA